MKRRVKGGGRKKIGKNGEWEKRRRAVETWCGSNPNMRSIKIKRSREGRGYNGAVIKQRPISQNL